MEGGMTPLTCSRRRCPSDEILATKKGRVQKFASGMHTYVNIGNMVTVQQAKLQPNIDPTQTDEPSSHVMLLRLRTIHSLPRQLGLATSCLTTATASSWQIWDEGACKRLEAASLHKDSSWSYKSVHKSFARHDCRPPTLGCLGYFVPEWHFQCQFMQVLRCC